jgi:signal transduction histidine kinase
VYVAEGDDPLVLLGPPLSALASGDALTATARLADGAVVEARRPRAVLRRDVVEELTPIVVNGLLSLGVAVLAGFLLSRRLARPFQELAHQASLLGEPGGADVVLPRQTVREAEAISTALRTSSARLALLLRREREFARNATHQLRTPLTGIRLRVEDVIRWPETPAPVREELDSVLSEVDRLSETVTDLLALAREERLRPVEDTLLSDVVAVLERRWSPLAATSGRSLRAQAPSTPVAMARGPVDQILDVLVDNALRHGSGAVTVTGEVDRSEVVLAVRDEGCLAAGESFTFARGASRRSSGGQGIGLALSAELARAMGGRLCVARREPTSCSCGCPG